MLQNADNIAIITAMKCTKDTDFANLSLAGKAFCVTCSCIVTFVIFYPVFVFFRFLLAVMWDFTFALWTGIFFFPDTKFFPF